MNRVLNRGAVADRDASRIARVTTGLQAWMHLSTSAISNLNTIAMIPFQTNRDSFFQGFANTVRNSQATREFANAAGANENIIKQAFAAVSKDHSFSPTRLYGLDAEEKMMRTMSAESGKAYAQQLFNDLKKGAMSEEKLQRLRDLTLDNPLNVLKQSELSEQQLKRAAYRTAEISQGLAKPYDLPYYWTNSSLANILTLFHKYQFSQTKILKDIVKRDGAKVIPILFGASQIAGELTGDAKATLTGGMRAAFSGDPSRIPDQIEQRGSFWEDKWGLPYWPARMMENASQSFALGIYADLIEMMAGTGTDAMKRGMGSAAGDIIKLFDIAKKGLTGDLSGAGVDAIGMAPLVGPPLRQELK